MNRLALVALLTLLPAVAGAQAIRCKDPATGKILYTDQPCKGGELVVPQRSEADIARDAATAAAAREREHDRAIQQREQRNESKAVHGGLRFGARSTAPVFIIVVV